jgi:hypothetical protein
VLHLPQPITIVPTSMPNPSSRSATQSSPSPVSGTGTPACANSRGKTDECLAQASDRSADSHDVRTAEIRPAPLPSSPPPQGSADDSQQGIAHHAKSLLRLFRGGSPRAASDTPSSTSSAAPPASAASASSASASAEVRAAVTGSASSTEPANSAAQIPAADLAPLYNYVQDCRACQLQLTAAKQNASDDAAKIRALTRERDAAVTAAKGGPLWLRLKRNAHWLAIGAAVGAVTSAAALCHTNC